MFKDMSLQERFGSRFCFDDGIGAGSGGNGEQGGQGAGQIDYSKVLDDPKFQEALLGSEFYKKNVQSAEDRIRTKYTGEKKTIEQQMSTMNEEMAVLKNERLENVKTSVIEEVGIPLKFRGRITGSSKEEMIESAKVLKADIEELVASTVDIRLKSLGTDPEKEKKESPVIKNDLKSMFKKV